MTWLEANIIAVVGWLGALLGLTFLFGRRLSRMEATDARLTETVTVLSVSVTQVGAGLQACDVRLARLEEVRVSVDERLAALSAQLGEIGRDVKALASTVDRVEERVGALQRHGGRDDGKT